MKRAKRPSRLAWFAMDVDAFLDDPRMQGLTNREKASWALILIKSFRNKGTVITDPAIVAEQSGISAKEAKVLLGKLMDNQLLIPAGKLYVATSPRLQKEHEMAQASYDRYSDLGKASAEKNGATNLQLVK